MTQAQVQHGVISRRQAIEAGMAPGAIDYRLRAGQWDAVFRGAYRLVGTQSTWEQEVMAGCLAAGPAAVASHRAAAALLGIPGTPRWVEVTVPYPRHARLSGLRCHQTRLLEATDCEAIQGIPVTSPARTLVDLAAIYDDKKLAPMLDYALAHRLVSRTGLEGCAKGLHVCGNQAGTLQRLLTDRPAAGRRPMGSEFEAALWHGLRLAGVPLPVAQYELLLPDGTRVYLDFAYPQVRLALEADSYLWHASLSDWQRDRARNNEVTALGWAILPLTSDLVICRPAEMARQVAAALASRGGCLRG